MKLRKEKPVIIKGKKLEAMHNLFHDLEKFKYATSQYCMGRDKTICHDLAGKIKDNLETILL